MSSSKIADLQIVLAVKLLIRVNLRHRSHRGARLVGRFIICAIEIHLQTIIIRYARNP